MRLRMRTSALRHVLAFVLLCLLASGPSNAADKRLALVIGNAAYTHAGTLANPRNDAADMAAALRKVGFRVITGNDLGKAGFDRTLREFAKALAGAEVGLFFYAGHGLQVAGESYLVPVDARLTTAAALEAGTVRLERVLGAMQGAANSVPAQRG